MSDYKLQPALNQHSFPGLIAPPGSLPRAQKQWIHRRSSQQKKELVKLTDSDSLLKTVLGLGHVCPHKGEFHCTAFVVFLCGPICCTKKVGSSEGPREALSREAKNDLSLLMCTYRSAARVLKGAEHRLFKQRETLLACRK